MRFHGMSRGGGRKYVAVQGECYLLCVDNCELRAATDPKGAEASRLSQAQAADIAAVFWREWSSGKPVLVKNVRGQISWEPKVHRPRPCYLPLLHPQLLLPGHS